MDRTELIEFLYLSKKFRTENEVQGETREAMIRVETECNRQIEEKEELIK